MKRGPGVKLAVLCAAVAGGVSFAGMREANAFAYLFAGDGVGLDIVTHAKGYTGSGGALTVTVGIDPTSSFATQMVIPTQNVVNTWNGLLPTTGNLGTGISTGQVDYETVLLHEMGHAIGLHHVNIGGSAGNQNYTASTDGPNNAFDVSPGPDGIIGSADDVRGDDGNLNYFRVADNNPFATNLGVVDSTTYSRDLADLPAGDAYSANADRNVAAALGFADTEGVMQQGSFFGETQRALGADDVAGVLYAQSGVDGIAGTEDDYILTLDFLGITGSADILIDFDNAQTAFAVTNAGGSFLTADHVVITSASIFFNTGYNWYFNQQSSVVDAPGAAALLGFGLVVLARSRRRRAA